MFGSHAAFSPVRDQQDALNQVTTAVGERGVRRVRRLTAPPHDQTLW